MKLSGPVFRLTVLALPVFVPLVFVLPAGRRNNLEIVVAFGVATLNAVGRNRIREHLAAVKVMYGRASAGQLVVRAELIFVVEANSARIIRMRNEINSSALFARNTD